MNEKAWDTVRISRMPDRLNGQDCIRSLCDSFLELHGDRCMGDDPALIGGIGILGGRPVTVLAQFRGKDAEDARKHNYAMVSPDGYRKALRLALEAERFGRPVICFVDTPGADAGVESEYYGQASAIARDLQTFSSLRTPVISVILGQGGSGGALAMAVADRVYMLRHATYSILSPEGFANILYKDATRVREAAEAMRMTAGDLMEMKIIDGIIDEADEGVQADPERTLTAMKTLLTETLAELSAIGPEELVRLRRERYRHY